ncbi:hypothetical protein LTS15_011048 [Exophiala xenobiotica]|nr:hypothetical protein LTS15_011048 [Exophiala xenobiotica]
MRFEDSAPPSAPYRLIVAVDYDPGLAYVPSNKVSDDIVIITKWPNSRGNAWKTPSTISYASENPKLDRNHWGFEVTRTHKQYSWTKLLLDCEIDLTQHDDPLLAAMYGSGFLRLPEGKSARAVVKDYLQELYQFLVQSIEKDIGREVLNTMPMECWITIPAIWSDRAQADTRAAALEAGFGSRKSDKVNVIPEPEAGALYALKPYLGERAVNPIKAGEHFLICDCGGGTVDIVTYEVLQVTPCLSHKEKCRGNGKYYWHCVCVSHRLMMLQEQNVALRLWTDDS